MGIRPQHYVLFGIDNLKMKGYEITDSRFNPNPKYLVKGREDWWNERIEPIKIKKYEDCKTREEKEQSIQNSLINNYIQENGYSYGKRFYELIQHDSEYGLGNVFGYVIDHHSSDDLFYVMSAIDRKYGEPGYTIVPGNEARYYSDFSIFYNLMDLHKKGELKYKDGTIPKHFPFKLFKEMIRKAKETRSFDILLEHKRNRWLYSPYDWIQINSWVRTTQYIFRELGLFVENKDLKLMHYWQWS